MRLFSSSYDQFRLQAYINEMKYKNEPDKENTQRLRTLLEIAVGECLEFGWYCLVVDMDVWKGFKAKETNPCSKLTP
jgi:hypothetical protein